NVSTWIGTSMDIDARVRADRALRMLAEASRKLGTTLEEGEAVFADVLRGALDVLADAAMLDVRVEGSQMRRLARVARGFPEETFDDPRFSLGPGTVAYTGRPEVHFDVRAEIEESRSGRGGEILRFLGELAVSAYMCLPLVSRGRTIGALTFVRCRE